ncbi:MAG: excinuclease ABC subunit A [Hyphococcus sp.]
MERNARVVILKAAAFALLIGPGLIMVSAPATPLLGWVEAFLDLAHQPLDGGERIDDSAGRLLNAILGGVLVGFGAMIWLTAERVYRNNPDLGRPLILAPMSCWFVADSAGSILAGAWFNAVLNAAFFALFLAPLLWPAGKRAETAA